jgi:T4-like virus tail tube protein gp19
VTLKRGFLTDTRLWDWLDTDPPDKRTVVITPLDEQRVPQVRFVLRQAWPVEWSGPHLLATSSLAYRDGAGRGFEREFTHDLQTYDGLPTAGLTGARTPTGLPSAPVPRPRQRRGGAGPRSRALGRSRRGRAGPHSRRSRRRDRARSPRHHNSPPGDTGQMVSCCSN